MPGSSTRSLLAADPSGEDSDEEDRVVDNAELAMMLEGVQGAAESNWTPGTAPELSSPKQWERGRVRARKK